MKKKLESKQICLICVAVFFALVLLLGIGSNAKQKSTGIDIYLAPEKTPFGGSVTRDYMRIQSDRKSYSTDEEIVLDGSCGFYKPPNGYGAETLSFDVACCEYIDVCINGEALDKYPGTHEEFVENCYGYRSGRQEKFYYLETEDFDADQLILKKGSLGQINKESLQYHFTVTLRVNPDAPESFSGSLYIRVYDHSYGNAYITVNFHKDGDTVTLLSN